MPDLRRLLDTMQPRVTAVWGPAAAYDLEMRVEPLAELAQAIERIGPEAFEAELASFLAGPKPKAVAIGLLAQLRRRPQRTPPAQVAGLEWEPPPAAVLERADPIEAWSAAEAAETARADALAAPVVADPTEVLQAVEVDKTAFIVISRPVQTLTRYHESLLRLLTPCAGPPAVQ